MRLLIGCSAARKGLRTRVGLVGPVGLALGALAIAVSQGEAAPYASGVSISGTTVNFILNEPADALTYSINGGAAVTLDGTTKGLKSFSLGAASDTFSIVAEKNAATGYTIPTGGTIPVVSSGLSQVTPEAGLNVISDDASVLTRYNSPRGVSVSKDPNAPNFGSVYISNSAAGSVVDGPTTIRTLTNEGLYALRADGSDAFGYGDDGKNPPTNQDNFPAFSTSSSNSPFKLFAAPDGNVYVADYSDINGTVFRVDGADFGDPASRSDIMLAGIGGPGYTPPAPAPFPDGTAIPPTQNHGSLSAVHIEGSLAGGNLVLYGVDEDINSAHFGGTVQNDRNSVWKWEIGSTVNSSVTPTKIGGGLIGDFPQGGILIDMERGADGKFYLSQNRSAGAQVGIQVLDATGVEVFNSLTESRAILNDPAAADIFRNVLGIAISPDQQWLAAMLNGSDVAVVPLVDGIPDIANRLVVNSAEPNINSGRDINFDAAGNIHYVSSGQGRYRVLAPGGETVATTSFDGTDFDFTITSGEEPTDDADFDGDGDVDGADFLTWQRGVGNPGDQPDGDANGDNIIDGADLDIWEMQFGQGAATPAAAAVPEPGTWALAVLAGLACLLTALPRRRLAVARVVNK